jgi:hypothetical protein
MLGSMAGLGPLSYIGGDTYIGSNPSLASLDGLQSLDTVAGYLNISSGLSLSSLTGLDSLTTVLGDLRIFGNPELTNFDGLNNLEYIGDGLYIIENETLEDISSLITLAHCGNTLEISYNGILRSLSGLDNLDHTALNELIIEHNDSLSMCAVRSICDYISTPIVINAWILYNAPGCDTDYEVYEACQLLGSIGISQDNSWKFVFDPENKILQITRKGESYSGLINIYNLTGSLVRSLNIGNSGIRLSDIKSGFYLIEVANELEKVWHKLVI